MPAGDIGEALKVRQNTMSNNLSILLKAGLVKNHRDGRVIRYFADRYSERVESAETLSKRVNQVKI